MDTGIQIIPNYTQPHVSFHLTDNTFYDETVAVPKSAVEMPYSTCVVTGAPKGIDNTFVRLSDLETKISIFGKSDYLTYGQASMQAEHLFNGSTNVWFCRVLPDNATYAGYVVLAHYKKGQTLDSLGQATGTYKLDVKFSVAYASSSDKLPDGCTTDATMLAFAQSLATTSADPITGYLTQPLYYVRSTGRGKYGNDMSVSISRDSSAEADYNVKMYRFKYYDHSEVSQLVNEFSGSLVQSVASNMSTSIDDVIDQYTTGSVPIYIHPFADTITLMYELYREILTANLAYLSIFGNSTDEDLAELATAQAITETDFDPVFGYLLNTTIDEKMPYYTNYTILQSGSYVSPTKEIPNDGTGYRPLSTSDWSEAYVGATVLMVSDPLNSGLRWKYTIISINSDGSIIYDDGVEAYIDEDQYDGTALDGSIGLMFSGGHDGDFQEIDDGSGILRTPNEAEMKLLLSKEYVKAFRGELDRNILSPSRIALDFIFDANYNMTSDAAVTTSSTISELYAGSTVLSDSDMNTLSVTMPAGASLSLTDLNVKKAMYDLNEFRNKNGMTIRDDIDGAGCHLYLDCNLTGDSGIDVNYELISVLQMIEEFNGRATSVDLGYYQVYDKYTGKKVKVTVAYFLSQYLVPHLIKYGLNKPFVNSYAQLTAITANSYGNVTGTIVRDTFRPNIDLIDWDIKEWLYKARVNYYTTSNEGRTVSREVQNTRQLDASALLEENNVRVLNRIKKNLEKASKQYLYEWNTVEARKGYTDAQMEAHRSYIGTMVQDLRIEFSANEWEQERMIMKCYASIKFKGIIKRVILDVNIDNAN